MSHCDDCFKGVKHEGTPEGKWVNINGVEAYVGTPKGDYPKEKVVLFLSDVFGAQLVNNQLLVDAFARYGFKTVMPDLFEGDPVPVEVMDGNLGSWNRDEWIPKHNFEVTRPIVDKILAAFKEEGVVSIGATGYCYGARLAFDLAFEDLIKVVAVSHPSRLQVPEDLERYASTAKAPLLINSCTVDQQFPPESSAKADEVLGGGKFAPGYKRTYYEGLHHGFAVRGDMSNPKAKAGLEGAFTESAEWFAKYL